MRRNIQKETSLGEEEVRQIAAHYDALSDEELVEEANSAIEHYVWIQVPGALAHQIELTLQRYEDLQIGLKKKARRSA
jgi:hypothetical protein